MGRSPSQPVLQCLCPLYYRLAEVYNLVLIFFVHQWRGDHKISGGAVGRNPISILIPCHRVIGANGALTGFAGGIDKKIKLLNLERSI